MSRIASQTCSGRARVTISFLTVAISWLLCLGSALDQTLRRVGDDAAGGEVDRGDGGAGEGEQEVGGAGAGDLEDVAGAVVEDGADGAEGGAAGVDDGEADQVGVVELVVGRAAAGGRGGRRGGCPSAPRPPRGWRRR